MDNTYDLIIIGAGPAGLTAAIYASRAMLKFVLLEKEFPGGQIIKTYEVDNYPGIKAVSGYELSSKMVEHAESLGVEIQTEDVVELSLEGEIKKVVTTSSEYLTKTIILATGAVSRKLGTRGEDRFYGMGVSPCATCDGGFYKGRTTAVIGGSYVATEDAIFLSRICKKVYLVHRRHELRSSMVLQEKLFKTPNIEIIWDSTVSEIGGGDAVEFIAVDNKITGAQSKVPVDGVFIAVGTVPNSELVQGKLATSEGGWIVTDENCETSVKGVFAVGDVREKPLRQVVTSCADGAVAAVACNKYL